MNRTEEEKMTTQKELLAQLKNRAAVSGDNKEPLPPFVRFRLEGDSIQGVVKDVFITTAWSPRTKSVMLDKQGNEVPQMNVTLELAHDAWIKEAGKFVEVKAGTLVRQGFSMDLLWKLSDALDELGLDELPVGAIIASKWEGMFVNKAGEVTSARDHKVIVKVAE